MRTPRSPSVRFLRSLICILGLLVLGTLPAWADTMVFVEVDQSGGGGVATLSYDQWLGMMFSLDATWTNVAITPFLYCYSGGPATVWLTTAVGPGATSADVVATYSMNNLGTGWVTLLSGLTLPAGTYYFLLTTDSAFAGGWSPPNWPLEIYTAPGVGNLGSMWSWPQSQHDTTFPPASTWAISQGGVRPIEITGTPAAVPEPGTLLLVVTGLAATVWSRKRVSARH